MIALSFRIKLLLAMMVLVVGVTSATLFVTRAKVQATYMKVFQNQFEAEVNYFTAQQETRLTPDKERCAKLAKSPEFRAALATGDPEKIYAFATNVVEKPTVLNQRAFRAEMASVEQISAGIQRNRFFRVLNAKGEILHFSDPRIAIKTGARKRLESQLAAVQRAMATLDVQPVGYLAPERTNGAVELMEVIVTKVSDPDTKETLGALLLGVPFSETSENQIFRFSHGGVETGIWLDDRIHSRTIPKELREEFAKIIAARVKPGANPRDTMDLVLGNEPRRAFFKLLNPNSPFPPAYQVSLYSLKGALKTQRELLWSIMAFSAAALGGASLLSFALAHGFSIPLRQLVKGTIEIRRGNFQYKVPVRSGDEVGELARSFNEMADGLAQKELYRTVLNTVADEKVAQALLKGQLALGGEVREVTVVFCDIRGFTALTQSMPPEEVIEMLNEHMTALTRIVKENNGVLDKFVGDLLMALFGAPVHHEHDTINAARCAMQLIAERERLNATSRHQLQVGVGVATGKVVAGCMGSVDRLNYTVLGERVNLASRLCEQAGPGKVLIDQTTKDKLGDCAATALLVVMNLKGFSENVAAYELKTME